MTSIRARLFASFGLAVVVTAALTVGVASLVARGFVERQALENLGRRVALIAAALDGPVRDAEGLRTRLFRREGELLALPGEPTTALGVAADRIGDAALATGEATGRLEIPGRDVLFAVADTPDGPIVLARPARLGVADWRPFAGTLILSGMGGAAVAAVVSLYLARRITRPLRQLAGATRRLAEGDREVRVPVEGRDELATLASSFNEMAEQLRTARDAERAFLLSVSHELNTPLTAIRGYAEAIREEATAPGEAADVIGREAERLERLVRDLLDLARLGQRQFSVRREPVDLAEVAREAERRYAPRAREFGVEISVEARRPAWALGDRDRVLQVVSNLVENALRCTPTGGRVAVRAGPEGLAVQDTGPGLAPEDLPRAFERFFLFRKYGADRPVGSGLGLAIVRELVGAMGGRVEVESEAGAGTTFRVGLPRAEEPVPAPAEGPRPPPGPSPSGTASRSR